MLITGNRMKAVFLVLIAVGLLACSEQAFKTTTIIRGTLTGHDGRPLKKAGVYLFYEPGGVSPEFTEVAPDSQFHLSTERTGLLFLRFAGFHHRLETAAVLVEEPSEIEIRARLATPDYPEDFGSLELVSEPDVGSERIRIPLDKQTDGTYTVEVETEAESLSFRITGEHPATRWLLPDTETYLSIGRYNRPINAQVESESGTIRVNFDPSILPRSDRPAQIDFVDTVRQKFNSIVLATLERSSLRGDQLRQARLAAHEGVLKGNWVLDHLAPSTGEMTSLEERIRKVAEPMVRKALLMDYLHLTETASTADPELVSTALDELGPASPLWWWPHPWSMAGLLGSAIGKTVNSGEYEGYLIELLNYSPTPQMKARAYGLLYGFVKREAGKSWGTVPGSVDWLNVDPDEIARRAISEFPENPYTKSRILPNFNPDRNIQVGKPVPKFSVPLLGADGKTATDQNIDAKVYLVDFWATWCGPCIGKMPGLHFLYEKYHPAGFEILAYSLDDSVQAVEQFRKEKWPMPWLNAIDPGKGFEAQIVKDLGAALLEQTIILY